MRHDAPLVSVVIPCYNAASTIERTLASVRAQTHGNLEILVVDDGSTDATADIVEALVEADGRIRLFRQPNAGVAAARNRAMEEAEGAYLAPIDADDTWLPDKIALQVARMEELGPACGLVYGWWIGIDGRDRIAGAAFPWGLEGAVAEALTYINFIGNASVPLFRREAIEAVGGYDPSFRTRDGEGCEDWDLCLRVAERYRVGLARAYLAAYRGVSGSMSHQCRAMARSFDFAMEGVLRRRPDTPRRIVRWSRANFYLWLMSVSYATGDFAGALYWLARTVAHDPASFLATSALWLAVKSAFRLSIRPVTRLVWPEHADWIAFRERVRGEGERLRLEELPGIPERRARPWPSRWKPYDWIRRRRWRWIRERGRDDW